jgi:[protein-PII] uridylyltransferase
MRRKVANVDENRFDQQAIESSPERKEPVSRLRQTLERHHVAQREAIRAGQQDLGLDVGRAYAALYDALLSRMFAECRANTGYDRPVCIGAVGSYGRSTLSPKSDLDVRLLCLDVEDATVFAEALLYRLWDAGLDIGHQVVTPSELIELARTDLTTATALLDWRHVAGDTVLGNTLIARAFSEVFRRDRLGNFGDRLEAYNRTRHERYGGSVYLLEPNVKNGAGGLRDLDVALWCARAQFGIEDLSELATQEVLLEREWLEFERARIFLTRVRNALHFSVGRKTDRLTFDQQEILAERLGYGTDSTAVERLMSEYYRSARIIRRTSDDLLSRLRPAPRGLPAMVPLAGGLARHGDRVTFLDPGLVETRPGIALTLYETAIEHNLGVGETARRAIRRATSSPAFCDALRRDEGAAERFRRLVCTVDDVRFGRGSVLRELHDTGLLLALVPEFAPVVGRVHHDTYHVFTVDEHSLAAVDHLRKLVRGVAPNETLASRLAAELPEREVVFFAALLHDVGKVLGAHGHAERGAQMADGILRRLGFPTEAVARTQRLIRLHLRLYLVATRRDIEDPRILSELCDEVGTVEALRELFLLTVADISTTSAGSMTAWTKTMLDSLLMHAERAFSERRNGNPPQRDTLTKRTVLALWPNTGALTFLRHFLSGLPDRYLLANDPEMIVAHARFAESSQGQRSSVRLGQERSPYAELWVVADDRPGLLALVAGSFREARLDVLSAQICSWMDGQGKTRSLDLFWVRHRGGEAVSERHLARIRDSLDRLLTGEQKLQVPSNTARGYGATSPFVETRVTVDNHCGSAHTVVEVITKDRPDLLLRLATALERMGLSVWFAKINTEGDRVADVFYVSDAIGRKITDPAGIRAIEEQLLRAAEAQPNPRQKPVVEVPANESTRELRA